MSQPDSFRDHVQRTRLFYRRRLAVSLAVAIVRKEGCMDTSAIVRRADEIARQLAVLEDAELATRVGD